MPPGRNARGGPSKKKACREGRTILFLDETGHSFRARPGTTWARRGVTPVLTRLSKRREVSSIVAVTSAGRLYARHFRSSLTSELVIPSTDRSRRVIATAMSTSESGHSGKRITARLETDITSESANEAVGIIINLASRAIAGAVRGVHYSASKGGIVAMTRAMALELAPHQVRVNAIAPGLTDTAQPRDGNSEEQIAEAARSLPLGRMAMPADIAQTATFLASDASALMTGQTLHVNGGSYMP